MIEPTNKDSHDLTAVCETIFHQMVHQHDQVADRLGNVRLVVDDLGDLDCSASVKEAAGHGEELEVIVDSQLLELMHTWCHLFSWVQTGLTRWSDDEDEQTKLAQILLELR